MRNKTKQFHLLFMTGVAASVSFAGPADRTTITNFLDSNGSALTPIDKNGDCGVSDVDVALAVLNNLKAKYGDDYDVSDLNGDGEVTALDVHFAIFSMIRTSFGKTTQFAEAVGTEDVINVIIGVAALDLSADVNVDGTADAADIAEVVGQVGKIVYEDDIAQFAWEIFSYLNAFETHGVDAFLVENCMGDPEGHLEGVSNTWPPDAGRQWPANHIVVVSDSWSGNDPVHDFRISKMWPPNHTWEISKYWPPPEHHFWDSTGDDGGHDREVSSQWPANHRSQVSEEWGDNHEVTVSRGWPPSHTPQSSAQLDYPPEHDWAMSDAWGHDTRLSADSWPPNHQVNVSQGWGPGHDTGASSAFPPGHVIYASNSWPGPNPWPPSHALSISESWGEPGPGNWPMFPPDHNWWDTANDVFDD